MDRAKLLPVIPSLNKVLQAGLHVDSPLKANALVYTSSGSETDKISGHRLSKQAGFHAGGQSARLWLLAKLLQLAA